MRTILATLTISLFLSVTSFAREWSDGTGKFKIEADFVKMDGDKVLLQGSDGKQYRIPLNKLCEADQSHAKKLAAEGPGQKPHASSDAPVNDKDLQTVRAEGVGSTGDEALKDAFRNAVRQVVGAVVDAETMTKNDQVIDDKVLTYSDGFVKHYEEISKKPQGSLVRIKIEAKVERRSVVAKLQAANVTTAKVDGKSMFAEVVSDEEAKKNATQLLVKALTPLPTLLTAELDGMPVPDREKNELVFNVLVKPDRKAFDAFRTQLQGVLDKIALSRSSVMSESVSLGQEGTFGINKVPEAVGSVGKWQLWLNTADYGSHTKTEWTGYTLDSDQQACLAVLKGQTFVTLAMLDKNGVVITKDEFLIKTKTFPNHNECRALMRYAPSTGGGRGRNLFVAPYTITVEKQLSYSPHVHLQRRVKITLDELHRITEIKCKVEYRLQQGMHEYADREDKPY